MALVCDPPADVVGGSSIALVATGAPDSDVEGLTVCVVHHAGCSSDSSQRSKSARRMRRSPLGSFRKGGARSAGSRTTLFHDLPAFPAHVPVPSRLGRVGPGVPGRPGAREGGYAAVLEEGSGSGGGPVAAVLGADGWADRRRLGRVWVAERLCWVWIRWAILTLLWASTPRPHQVWAPVRSSRRGAVQAVATLEVADASLAVGAPLDQAAEAAAVFGLAAGRGGLALAGITTVLTPRSVSARSTLASP